MTRRIRMGSRGGCGVGEYPISGTEGQRFLPDDDVVVRVSNLSVVFDLGWVRVPAVTDVSFELRAGKTLGVVGESGCGKSVTAQALMRILPDPPGRIANGSILYRRKHGDGETLVDIAALKAGGREIRAIRGFRLLVSMSPLPVTQPAQHAVIGWCRRLSDEAASLSKREQEVLCLVCEELTSAQIAQRLHISPATVETHRQNIANKLGAKTVVGQVRAAIRAGLIAP